MALALLAGVACGCGAKSHVEECDPGPCSTDGDADADGDDDADADADSDADADGDGDADDEPDCRGEVWRTEDIDDNVFADQGVSLAIDSLGRAHVAFLGDDRQVMHGVREDGAWRIETVIEGEAESCAIVMGLELVAEIFYRAEDSLYRASVTDSGSGLALQSTGLLDHGERDDNRIFLGSDANRHWHAAYTTGPDPAFLYDTDSGVERPEVVAEGLDAWAVRVAADELFDVHLAYLTRAFEAGTWHLELQYASNSSGEWTHETVEGYGHHEMGGGGEEVWPAGIQVDSNGEPRILFSLEQSNHFGPTFAGMIDARRSEDGWQRAVADTGDSEYVHLPDFVLDDLDHAHVVYTDQAGLQYATDATGAWVVEAIDPEGTRGAIALAHDGTVRVAYIASTEDPVVRYARRCSLP